MKKTKIDWADSTWNPVTGCLHGCDYCYARRIAERFGGLTPDSDVHTLEELNRLTDGSPDCYPWGFAPTFHRYRLDEPQHWKKPRNIFVCSMADLFGDWVPDEWIQEVFAACENAPQHRYLFLTKNPKRYLELAEKGVLIAKENFWYGTTATTAEAPYFFSDALNTFVSAEPILGPFRAENPSLNTDWVILGAQTGSSKGGLVVPRREWVDDIVRVADEKGVKVFMKSSLRGLMGDEFRQEYPWEVER